MNSNFILKKNPKIEITFKDCGFELIDVQNMQNTGFYMYSDLVNIELNNIWFPRFAFLLRGLTWILNGVPYFPDAESYSKSSLILHFEKTNCNFRLTSTFMDNKAKALKKLLDQKNEQE